MIDYTWSDKEEDYFIELNIFINLVIYLKTYSLNLPYSLVFIICNSINFKLFMFSAVNIFGRPSTTVLYLVSVFNFCYGGNHTNFILFKSFLTETFHNISNGCSKFLYIYLIHLYL